MKEETKDSTDKRMIECTRKIPKYSDTRKLAVINLNFEQCDKSNEFNDADGIANSVDPDQIAPLGTV